MPVILARFPAARARLAVAAGALCALAACGDATAPLPTTGPARELAFSTYGFAGTATRVRLVGDTVVYVEYNNARGDSAVTRRVPSGDDWREFWRTVDAVGVRRWPSTCTGTDGQDGGGFHFTLAWSDARRTGDYSNSNPTRSGACSTGAGAYDALGFQGAVYGLAGIPFYIALDAPRHGGS